MERNQSNRNNPVRDMVRQRIGEIAYRIRPDQPGEGLEHISIAAEAQRACFSRGTPVGITVWNTFKGHRERYYNVLAEQTTHADLILLQEFRHDPLLETSHRTIFSGRDAGLAVSFYTRPNHEAPTGVCTVSSVHAIKTLFLLSRYLEPVTRTPKTAICTYYPIESLECPPEQALLVLNSHGINFRLRRPFLEQMLQFEAHLRQHAGPIILVGDFNTWEKGRVRILDSVARSIGLTHVRFPPGIKTVGRHELDRVYVRGGSAVRQHVVADAAASDHSLLAFQFIIS
ncbi:MAG TPA: endonuclease/exonuclease/phosphatase family protein [Roseiflexaceae bacterium]|jgi:endonuclease/exonuclease/phosphatase (EEP) superfamily protein YafD|nr:endonuclease/exonuclease/phosphatase family protein [Roseiflexaceae bacterium]